MNVILDGYLCSLFFASEEWKQLMINNIPFPFVLETLITFSWDRDSSKSNIYKNESDEITSVCSDIQYGWCWFTSIELLDKMKGMFPNCKMHMIRILWHWVQWLYDT